MNASPADGFAAFHQLVIGEPALFARLEAVSDPAAFATLAVRCGAERGLAFTSDDVEEALRTARRLWLERNLA